MGNNEANRLVAERMAATVRSDAKTIEAIDRQLSKAGIWLEHKSNGAIAWHRRPDEENGLGENDLALRQIALNHAVRTHEHSVDENLIVKAAKVYLAFLKGEETILAPSEVPHHPV